MNFYQNLFIVSLLVKCHGIIMNKKVSREFRIRLSEKLMDLGNLVAAALVVGQFVSKKEFSINQFIIGLFVMILCYVISYTISS